MSNNSPESSVSADNGAAGSHAPAIPVARRPAGVQAREITSPGSASEHEAPARDAVTKRYVFHM
jgi:hypothetical protein